MRYGAVRIGVYAHDATNEGGCGLAAEQAVDFTEALDARQLLFWRGLFEELLRACKDEAAAKDVFARFGAQAGLATARTGLAMFLRRSFGPWLAARHDSNALLLKLQAAEAGLAGG